MARMADWSAVPTFLAALPHLAPVGFARNLEAVVLRVGGEVRVAAGLRQRSLRLLIEHVAETLVEQQRENELLVVAGINGPAQERGRSPEVGFELLLEIMRRSRRSIIRTSISCLVVRMFGSCQNSFSLSS